MKVKFYDAIEDSFLKFAVIISKSDGKWVFCKHKDRSTYEIPGGHREASETIEDTTKRELKEEESYGMLYYADIKTFENSLHNEIELCDTLPTD